MSRTIITLSFYPIILIVCWTLTSVVDISSTFSHIPQSHGSEVFSAFALILPALQGFIHSAIFVVRNKVIRATWLDFFRERKFELIFYDDDGFGNSRSFSFIGNRGSVDNDIELETVDNVLNEVSEQI